MKTFIVGTFFVLGWTFYVLSDGADFVPEQPAVVAELEAEDTAEVVVAEVEPAEAPVVEPVVEAQVTRADTTILLDLSTAELIQPSTASLETAALETAVEDEATVETVLASIVEEVVVEEAPAVDLDIRFVAGSRVNMRSGPGTNYAVLDTLDGGTAAEVLEVDASGWARIRLQDTGTIGWMAERLLSES